MTQGSSEALDDTLEDAYHGAVSASPEPSVAGSMTSASLQHRTNMTMHVCWHRSLSVSASECTVAFRVCIKLLVLLWWQEFATRSVAVFFLTCHHGAGAEHQWVLRLGCLIGNRWMSRLHVPAI